MLRHFFKKHVPAHKPQTMKENTMEKKALYAIIKMVIDVYTGAMSKIAALENDNHALKTRVAELEKAAADDFALDAEMGNALQAILGGDTGGSMGGVTKAVPIV